MKLFAGIDAGQSSTGAVIGDENGRVLGRGRGPAADEIGQDGRSTRMHDAFHEAVETALQAAKLPGGSRFEQIVAGVSGYEGKIYGKKPDLATGHLELMHDVRIAHAGAFAGKPGIVVIAGTGSVACGVDDNGRELIIGGWGYLFGDEGGAFWISAQTLREAMHDEDAGEDYPLKADLLRFFGAKDLHALGRSFYAGEISRTKLASFAQTILQLAESQPVSSFDSPSTGSGLRLTRMTPGVAMTARSAAVQQVRAAAEVLVDLAVMVQRRLNLAAPQIAFVGGLLQSVLFAECIRSAFAQRLPKAQWVSPQYDAAVGALLLAYKIGGLKISQLQEAK